MATLSDTMLSKLQTHYVSPLAGLDDLIQRFVTDNPTYIPPFGTLTFYSAAPTESLTDAAYRWWSAYVP